jgi:hypothetical protein
MINDELIIEVVTNCVIIFAVELVSFTIMEIFRVIIRVATVRIRIKDES